MEDSLPGNAQRLQTQYLPNAEDFLRYSDGIQKWPNSKPSVTVSLADRPVQTNSGGVTCVIKQRIGNALENWRVSVSSNSIDLVDPTGQQRYSSRLGLRFEGSMPPVTHFIDSIVLIETQSELIAIDTLRATETVDLLQDSPMEYILWSESFGRAFVDETFNQNNLARRNVISQVSRPETMPWGELRHKNRKGFSVGPANRTGVVVATNGTLISLDPQTGSRRWVRNGIGSLPTILQDGNQIVVLDRTSFTRSIIDARDGRLIARDDWRDDFEPWCTAGRNVLSTYINKRDGNRVAFKIWDAFEKKVLIEKELASDIRAEVCEQERLVMWSASGELAFWDLRSGKEFTYQLPLPPKSSFKHMALERFGDAILVLTDGTSFQQVEFVKGDEGERIHKCCGPMIAIDLLDGHPLWENPLAVYDYRFPVSQIRTTPAISLVRLLKFKAGGQTHESGSVAILDIRNGKLLYSNNYLDPIRGLEFQSSVKLGLAELNVQYRGSELRVSWSDAAASRPDEEPFTEIGKLGQAQLEEGTPKEWLERLQSGIQDNPFEGTKDPFGVPKDRIIDAPKAR